MGKPLAKKVLVIGWDAADWKLINPLMDSGQMPTLEKLVNNGVMGNIATLDPPLSPMLWTSIATGKTADKHGILGFVEPDPTTMKIRPVSSTSRKVKAIWNILTQKGYKTHVVGWWPSHPADPVNGVCVSNLYSVATGNYGEPWPLAKGTVYPGDMVKKLKTFRIHPGELTLSHLLPFVPDAAKIDQEKDKSLVRIAKNLAECSSIHAATTWIMENQDWDFMAVYMVAIDHFCHSFMKFHPPRMKGVPKDLFELYKDVVNSAYRYHDMMLERLLQLAGPDTTIILLSDHGFHSDHLRPKWLPEEPAGPAHEHRPYGIIAMQGPGIKKDERIYGASILDLTPTVLTLFGLPIGKDMDGKPLLQAFDKSLAPEYIPSWEKVEGESGMHPSEMREDPWAAQEAMKQLVDLGYIEELETNSQENIEKITNESRYYLSRVYMHTGKYAKAIPILEKLYIEKPDKIRYGLKLAACYQATNNVSQCRDVIDQLKKSEAKELPHLHYLEGMLLIGENHPRKALESLKKAENPSANFPNLYIQLGNAYLKLHKWEDAEEAFIRALAIDAENAKAHYGLAVSYLRREMYEEAAEEALNAVGLIYQFPAAHYYLGEALVNLREYDRAEEAFQVCTSMMPGNKKAHQWLIRLYAEFINKPDNSNYHQKFISEQIKGTVTIVTGLPRSGTSMMMQMLNAGGMDVLTDNIRKIDENNPLGYFEYEKVKKIASDSSWLEEACDKCVKIAPPLLLFYLPDQYNYKIIFMQREMNEVIMSQQVMLKKRKEDFPVIVADSFAKQLKKADVWIKSQPNVSVLYVNYSDVIQDPEEQAENTQSFLDATLKISEMVKAVDKNLYRNQLKEW